MLIKNLFAVSAYGCLWMSTVTKYTYLPTPELINTTILIFKHEYNKNFIYVPQLLICGHRIFFKDIKKIQYHRNFYWYKYLHISSDYAIQKYQKYRLVFYLSALNLIIRN